MVVNSPSSVLEIGSVTQEDLLTFERAAPELSMVMPCLNEAETLATCIRKAQSWFDEARVEGEVIIADNGSTDGSQAIASALGARVIHVPARGYGSAREVHRDGGRGRQLRLHEFEPVHGKAARGI